MWSSAASAPPRPDRSLDERIHVAADAPRAVAEALAARQLHMVALSRLDIAKQVRNGETAIVQPPSHEAPWPLDRAGVEAAAHVLIQGELIPDGHQRPDVERRRTASGVGEEPEGRADQDDKPEDERPDANQSRVKWSGPW